MTRLLSSIWLWLRGDPRSDHGRICDEIAHPGTTPRCRFCGCEDTDLRLGCCFDCADAGEKRVAARGVLGHLRAGVANFVFGLNGRGRYDLQWAWQRLTRTGDYAPNGYFARSHPSSAKPAPDAANGMTP